MNEKISYKLIRLIYDYVKNSRQIDNNFVDNVVDIFVNELELNDYVKHLKIDNIPWNGSEKLEAADYSYSLKRLRINLQGLIDFSLAERNFINLDSSSQVFYLYTIVSRVLAHELEHANQFKKYQNYGNDIESIILKPCLRSSNFFSNFEKHADKLRNQGISEEDIIVYLKTRNEAYLKAYEYAPQERLAEVYSSYQIIKALETIKSVCPDLLTYYNYILYKNYIRGYKEILVPTKYFLEEVGSGREWEQIENLSKNLNMEERFRFGLPVSFEELDVTTNYTKELKSLVIS